jgi:hypothetical protein
MLYPLSYEGLCCMFAQRVGRVLVRWAREDYPASNGLCRVPCDRLLPTAPTRGADCRLVVPVIPAGTGAADGNQARMASVEGCAQCVVSGFDLRCGRSRCLVVDRW